jgi:hypothetical protein
MGADIGFACLVASGNEQRKRLLPRCDGTFKLPFVVGGVTSFKRCVRCGSSGGPIVNVLRASAHERDSDD